MLVVTGSTSANFSGFSGTTSSASVSSDAFLLLYQQSIITWCVWASWRLAFSVAIDNVYPSPLLLGNSDGKEILPPLCLGRQVLTVKNHPSPGDLDKTPGCPPLFTFRFPFLVLSDKGSESDAVCYRSQTPEASGFGK